MEKTNNKEHSKIYLESTSMYNIIHAMKQGYRKKHEKLIMEKL